MMPARRFTKKQDRQAEHIAESEKARGHSEKDAERIGYATVNKNKAKGEKKNNEGKTK
ncbi:MAG: hypothetical protein ACYDBJ_04080 [Aggregatilineales bacterium]